MFPGLYGEKMIRSVRKEEKTSSEIKPKPNTGSVQMLPDDAFVTTSVPRKRKPSRSVKPPAKKPKQPVKTPAKKPKQPVNPSEPKKSAIKMTPSVIKPRQPVVKLNSSVAKMSECRSIVPAAAVVTGTSSADRPIDGQLMCDYYRCDYVLGGDFKRKKALETLRDYLRTPSHKSRPIMIRGPTGCGKMTAILRAAMNLKFRVVVFEPSDTASTAAGKKVGMKKLIRDDFVRVLCTRSLFENTKTLVVVRSIDSMTEAENEAVLEGMRMVYRGGKKNQAGEAYHLIVTSTDGYCKQTKSWKSLVQSSVVYLSAIQYPGMLALFNRACEDFNIRVQPSDKVNLIRSFGGDARAMLNELELFRGHSDLINRSRAIKCGGADKDTSYTDYLFQLLCKKSAVYVTTTPPGGKKVRERRCNVDVPPPDDIRLYGLYLNAMKYVGSEAGGMPTVQALDDLTNVFSMQDVMRDSDFECDIESFLPHARAYYLHHGVDQIAWSQHRRGGHPPTWNAFGLFDFPSRNQKKGVGEALVQTRASQSRACGYLPSNMECMNNLMILDDEILYPCLSMVDQRLRQFDRMLDREPKKSEHRSAPSSKDIVVASDESASLRGIITGMFDELRKASKIGIASVEVCDDEEDDGDQYESMFDD